MAALRSEPLVRRCMTADPPGSKVVGPLNTLASGPGARAQILVVEDNYFVALTIENALTDAGYRVLAVVDSGEAALESVAEARPDLVLMDIRLAGDLNGIDTAVALRRQGIVSLFASAHFDEGIKARGAAARPAGWLVKPFSDAEVVDVVRLALRGGRTDA